MIDQRKRIFAVNRWLLDLALTAVSFFLAYRIRVVLDAVPYFGAFLEGHTVMPIPVYLWLLAVILPVWAVLLPLFRVYATPSQTVRHQILTLSKAIGFAWLVMAALQFFINADQSNRLIVLFTLVINYVFLVCYRVILFKFRKHGALDTRHVAVIGTGQPARDFARTIENHREWGLNLVGIFDKSDVRTVLESGGVDELILVADRDTSEDFAEVLPHCEELGVTARIVLNFFPHSIARMELHELDGFPLLSFSTTPTNEVLMFVRRIMDVILTSVLILITLPVVAAAAILIKLTSPGPVLFKQERCGMNGRPFIMYKFRSMIDNSEQLRFELEALNEMDGPVFKSSRDPRITLVGRIIRRFSIDELPQLMNVLRGDMSLVGPRLRFHRKFSVTSVGNVEGSV